jgi:ribosome small subunit-dependent GTPase A
VFIATIQQPFTPLSYLDAFLVMCEAYHIPVVIVFNKVDILDKEKDLDKLEDLFQLYSSIGYGVVTLDAWAEHTPATMQKILRNRTTFLAGLSGSGKSTLINKADPELNLRTSEISDYSQKGRHTTTYAERFPLAFGGYVIDAPGFSEFLPVDLKPEELDGYFREFRPVMENCRFANCLHLREPGCAIQEAMEQGTIAESRYNTYLKMVQVLRDEEKQYGPG